MSADNRLMPGDYPSRLLQPLVGEISWAKHLVILGKCKDTLEREFYIRMTRKFGWTKDLLIHQIENQSYMRAFAAACPDHSFVQPVVAQIPWLYPDELKGSLPTVEGMEAELTRQGRQE
jgi:hypothetical protein